MYTRVISSFELVPFLFGLLMLEFRAMNVALLYKYFFRWRTYIFTALFIIPTVATIFNSKNIIGTGNNYENGTDKLSEETCYKNLFFATVHSKQTFNWNSFSMHFFREATPCDIAKAIDNV